MSLLTRNINISNFEKCACSKMATKQITTYQTSVLHWNRPICCQCLQDEKSGTCGGQVLGWILWPNYSSVCWSLLGPLFENSFDIVKFYFLTFLILGYSMMNDNFSFNLLSLGLHKPTKLTYAFFNEKGFFNLSTYSTAGKSVLCTSTLCINKNIHKNWKGFKERYCIAPSVVLTLFLAAIAIHG